MHICITQRRWMNSDTYEDYHADAQRFLDVPINSMGGQMCSQWTFDVGYIAKCGHLTQTKLSSVWELFPQMSIWHGETRYANHQWYRCFLESHISRLVITVQYLVSAWVGMDYIGRFEKWNELSVIIAIRVLAYVCILLVNSGSILCWIISDFVLEYTWMNIHFAILIISWRLIGYKDVDFSNYPFTYSIWFNMIKAWIHLHFIHTMIRRFVMQLCM